MMGFSKNLLYKAEKEDILTSPEDYRNEILPLIVPVTLICHQAKKYNIGLHVDSCLGGFLIPFLEEKIICITVRRCV